MPSSINRKPRILVTNEVDHLPASRELLESHAEVIYRANPSEAELSELIVDVEAVITNLRQRITPAIIDAARCLKVIATPSTGTDHIDTDYAESRGILVQSLKNDYQLLKDIPSTAEHAFLLMISCLRQLPFAFDSVRKGLWERNHFRGRELQGRIIGILGYGRLGEIFSRFAMAFGMKVIACDPLVKINDHWVEQVQFDELLDRSEIISIHVHLSESTRSIINREAFAKMRNGVYLINTSRGAIIDENALLEALESKKVAGAGLDVLANELEGNIASDPLVKYAKTHTNLSITPHIGGCTYDAQEKAYRYTVEKLLKALDLLDQ